LETMVVNTLLYDLIWFVLYLILLFGPSVRDIWLSGSSQVDYIFDILFLVTVGALLLDMVLTGYISSNYLVFYYRSTTNNSSSGGGSNSTNTSGSMAHAAALAAAATTTTGESSRRGSRTSTSGGGDTSFDLTSPKMIDLTDMDYSTSNNNTTTDIDKRNQHHFTPEEEYDEGFVPSFVSCLCFSLPQFRVGSIDFWFDLIGTLTLLFDISMIYQKAGADPYKDITITLEDNDVLGNSWDQNRHLIKAPLGLYLILFRTLRIIRMKPKRVVHYMFRINLFFTRLKDAHQQRQEVIRTRQRIAGLSNPSTVFTIHTLRHMFADHRATGSSSSNGGGVEKKDSSHNGSPTVFNTSQYKRSMHIDLTKEEAASMIQRVFREAYGFAQPKLFVTPEHVMPVMGANCLGKKGGLYKGGIEGFRGDGFSSTKRGWGDSTATIRTNSTQTLRAGKRRGGGGGMLSTIRDGSLFKSKGPGGRSRRGTTPKGVSQQNWQRGPQERPSEHSLEESVDSTTKKKQRQYRRSIHEHAKGEDSSNFSNHGTSSGDSRKTNGSMVGSKMMRVTGGRVACGMFLAVLVTILFSYFEYDTTLPRTMITLHNIEMSVEKMNKDDTDGGNDYSSYVDTAIDAAIASAAPNLCEYYKLNDTEVPSFESNDCDKEKFLHLRDREISDITVCTRSDHDGDCCSEGRFDVRDRTRMSAIASLILTIYISFIWFIAVGLFSLPVSALIVIPIERMVRFLGMLVKDPLGYQNQRPYWEFMLEEEVILKKTGWKKEIMDGMETKFLINSISRISSLMKVGFGSAGVEIIRSNLEKGARKDITFGNIVGVTVSCIFLFSDIRGFTDVSECLQEEVFVFTNRIASVMHSYCNALGGSVNKNIGDAFLISWLLDSKGGSNRAIGGKDNVKPGLMTKQHSALLSNDNQADKALLSVVKTCIALYHDNFYLENMSENAKKRLRDKMSKRPGPLVQMGFGLHAGKAVQGAIGSERKLDATYISEAVEQAENLESSTKKYGVKMLMSGVFYSLLSKSCQNRCRKIDQIKLTEADESEIFDTLDDETQDVMELFTFDIVVEDLWQDKTPETAISNLAPKVQSSDYSSPPSEILMKSSGTGTDTNRESFLRNQGGPRSKRRWSVTFDSVSPSNQQHSTREIGKSGQDKLDLPTTTIPYNTALWLKEDIRSMRKRFTGRFFRTFEFGLEAYFKGEWKEAKNYFQSVVEGFDDPPSKYFLKKMSETNFITPNTFSGYGSA